MRELDLNRSLLRAAIRCVEDRRGHKLVLEQAATVAVCVAAKAKYEKAASSPCPTHATDGGHSVPKVRQQFLLPSSSGRLPL